MPEITPLSISGPVTVTPPTTPPSSKVVEAEAPAPAEAKPEAAPPVEAKKEPTEEEKRFALLTRKEKELLRQKREMAQHKKMIDEELAAIRPYKEAMEAAKVSKLEALKRLGISYDDVTQEVLGQSQPNPEQIAKKIVDERLNEFNQKLAAEQQRLQEEQYQKVLTDIRSEAQRFVETSEEFPLVKDIQGYDTIMRRIELEYHESGRVMSVEEAAKEYEAYLEQEIGSLSSKHEKLRSKIVPPQNEVKQAPVEPVIQKPKTLTNKQAASPQAKPLTAAEKRQRAIKVFYGESV